MLLPIHIYFYPYLVSIKYQTATIIDEGSGSGNPLKYLAVTI